MLWKWSPVLLAVSCVLVRDDLCEQPQEVDLNSYDAGYLKTPSTRSKAYPVDTSCAREVCTEGLAVLLELSLFDIVAEYDGSCLDFLLVNDGVRMCSPFLHGSLIPINARDRSHCFSIYFQSNSDGRTGRGAKIKFQTLSSLVGVYTLSSILGGQIFPTVQVKNYGYITSPSYPMPDYDLGNSSASLQFPDSCAAVRLEFVDFYLVNGNWLNIGDRQFVASLSGFSTVISLQQNLSVGIHLQLLVYKKEYRQRFLIKYTCISRGIHVGIAYPTINPVPMLYRPTYVTSELHYLAKQNLRNINNPMEYKLHLQTSPYRQAVFILLSSMYDQQLCNDNVQIKVYINEEQICNAGTMFTLTTNSNFFNIQMVVYSANLLSNSDLYNNDFVLLYQEGSDGIFDICAQDQITPNFSGVITSSNYPSEYKGEEHCVITLHNPQRQIISMEILDLETETVTEYGYDHDLLKISGSESGLISKLSGKGAVHHQPLSLSDTNITLEFISDTYINYRGFLISYTVLRDVDLLSSTTTPIEQRHTPSATIPVTNPAKSTASTVLATSPTIANWVPETRVSAISVGEAQSTAITTTTTSSVSTKRPLDSCVTSVSTKAAIVVDSVFTNVPIVPSVPSTLPIMTSVSTKAPIATFVSTKPPIVPSVPTKAPIGISGSTKPSIATYVPSTAPIVTSVSTKAPIITPVSTKPTIVPSVPTKPPMTTAKLEGSGSGGSDYTAHAAITEQLETDSSRVVVNERTIPIATPDSSRTSTETTKPTPEEAMLTSEEKQPFLRSIPFYIILGAGTLLVVVVLVVLFGLYRRMKARHSVYEDNLMRTLYQPGRELGASNMMVKPARLRGSHAYGQGSGMQQHMQSTYPPRINVQTSRSNKSVCSQSGSRTSSCSTWESRRDVGTQCSGEPDLQTSDRIVRPIVTPRLSLLRKKGENQTHGQTDKSIEQEGSSGDSPKLGHGERSCDLGKTKGSLELGQMNENGNIGHTSDSWDWPPQEQGRDVGHEYEVDSEKLDWDAVKSTLERLMGSTPKHYDGYSKQPLMVDAYSEYDKIHQENDQASAHSGNIDNTDLATVPRQQYAGVSVTYVESDERLSVCKPAQISVPALVQELQPHCSSYSPKVSAKHGNQNNQKIPPAPPLPSDMAYINQSFIKEQIMRF